MNEKKNATPWGQKEKEAWFRAQTLQRSYRDEVMVKIDGLRQGLEVTQYGALTINPTKYPLFMVRTKKFDPTKKLVLITGGVHGYETSGVHGALAFMKEHVAKYATPFDFICFPCLSPWAYETINRWNNLAIDPNRSFREDSPAEECQFFLKALSPFQRSIFAHFDLHETTDTDNSVFRLALESRDAKPQEFWEIPDGFYVVGNTHRPEKKFQNAVIDSVRKVTHIAPGDDQGRLIGVPIEGEGVISYDMQKLSLCGGVSGARFHTTTEVYPDSPRVTDEICNQAQVAAICGGLDHILSL